MALPTGVRYSTPIPAVIPVKKYPWLRRLVKELDFTCGNCSSAQGSPVYRTFEEAGKDPISGPPEGGGPNGPKGMVATRFLVYCPDCHCVPTAGPFLQNGVIDLLDVPMDYRRPARPQGASGDGITYDDGDEQEEVKRPASKAQAIGKRRYIKKITDTNPKARKVLGRKRAQQGEEAGEV